MPRSLPYDLIRHVVAPPDVSTRPGNDPTFSYRFIEPWSNWRALLANAMLVDHTWEAACRPSRASAVVVMSLSGLRYLVAAVADADQAELVRVRTVVVGDLRFACNCQRREAAQLWGKLVAGLLNLIQLITCELLGAAALPSSLRTLICEAPVTCTLARAMVNVEMIETLYIGRLSACEEAEWHEAPTLFADLGGFNRLSHVSLHGCALFCVALRAHLARSPHLVALTLSLSGTGIRTVFAPGLDESSHPSDSFAALRTLRLERVSNFHLALPLDFIPPGLTSLYVSFDPRERFHSGRGVADSVVALAGAVMDERRSANWRMMVVECPTFGVRDEAAVLVAMAGLVCADAKRQTAVSIRAIAFEGERTIPVTIGGAS